MAKPSAVRSIAKVRRAPFLPARAVPTKPTTRSGVATYYLSCTARSFGAYTALAERSWQGGFRGVLLAPVGLVFEPAEVLVGYQPGDSYTHALEWALTNPLDEIVRAEKPRLTVKGHQKLQQRFADALATVEGVELARQDADKLLQAATAELIAAQGGESVCIDGLYYDASYSHERVYLKRRNPVEDYDDEPEEVANDAGTKKSVRKRSVRKATTKRSRRVA